VATVGYSQVIPNAMNVVPGEVKLQVDIRGIFKASKDKVIHGLQEKIKEVGKKRQLQIVYQTLTEEEPVQLDSHIVDSIKTTCEQQKVNYLEMPSGAGHDAMNMAQVYPTGMIFVPSRGGISHHKNEFTSLEEIGTGVFVLKEEILKQAEVVQKQHTKIK